MTTGQRAQIFDPLRKKRVALTPEERVRQFFIQWLNRERGYSLSLMMSEHTVKYDRKSFRCDIVCFGRDMQPLVVVECKAPEVALDNSVIEQVTRYNMALMVKYLVITNGLATYAFAYDGTKQKYNLIKDIPHFENA